VDLSARISRPRHPRLVFTSAGDRGRATLWLAGQRSFDLMVAYYGSSQSELAGKADHFFARRGGKWPNLRYAYSMWPDLFAAYDAVFVADDDLEMTATTINGLFDVLQSHDSLKVLQPAFLPSGQNSYRVNVYRPFSLLRYTNYIEGGAPVFRQAELSRFMAVYDDELASYGVSWWYIHVLGLEDGQSAAVVDRWPCRNPWAREKPGGYREIDRLQALEARQAKAAEMARRHGFPAQKPQVYARKLWLAPGAVVAAARYGIGDNVRRLWLKVIRLLSSTLAG
jgi:hypothetical protein